MSIDDMIAVLQARKQGKKIQFRSTPLPEWVDHDIRLSFNFVDFEYRVKPQPREWWLSIDQCGCPSSAYATEELAKMGSVLHCGKRPVHVREVIED